MSQRTRKNTAIAVGLIAFLTVVLPGCATTPRAQYAQVQDTYIVTVQQLTNFYVAGEIDEETWTDDIVPLIHEGDRLLDVIKGYVVSGQEPPTDLYETLEVTLFLLTEYINTINEGEEG